MILRLPNTRAKRFADTKTDTDSDADDQKCNENFGNDPVPLA